MTLQRLFIRLVIWLTSRAYYMNPETSRSVELSECERYKKRNGSIK